MKKLMALLLILPMLVFSSGCATFGGSTPESAMEYFNKYQHIMKLGTQVAILALLEQNPTYAERIVSFAGYLETALEGQQVADLKALEELARDKIDWTKYNPTERLLVEAVITQVRVEIENVIAANGVNLPTPSGEIKMFVSTFLDWIEEGGRVFIAQQGNRSVIPILPPVS